MSQFDFTSIMDRKGKDATAVDIVGTDDIPIPDPGFDVIPMWIADMNFPTAPSITEAMAERVRHPSFGYFRTRDEYYEAIQYWQRERNGVENLPKEAIGYENGVLGGISSAVQAFTLPGESVLVHAPTYIGFTFVLKESGRNIVLSYLKQDEDGFWRMDYEDMDRKIKENNIHFAIMCSPHNPCGRVWSREELEKAMEVYKANDCVVVSDEIWSDLILNGNKHIPTQSISEDAKNRTIAMYAPSKTFSLAGLIGSYHIVYNKALHDRLLKASDISHYNSMNVLSMYALMGAYSKTGSDWVDELREVLSENVNYAVDFINRNFPGVSVSQPEGTYMLYLDCSGWCKENGKTIRDLIQAGYRVGVIWQNGEMFNQPHTIRMNLAVPTARVKEAMDRLQKYVF